MTVFLTRRRRVMSIFLSETPASPVFIPKCRTDNSIFSRSTRRPSQHLNGKKYSYLTIILQKLSEHLSEQTSVTHPAWREQQIKRRLGSRRCELDSSLAEQIRLTHQGARMIALTTVLRQDRLEKEEEKKEQMSEKNIAKKKSKHKICWFLLVKDALTRLTV